MKLIVTDVEKSLKIGLMWNGEKEYALIALFKAVKNTIWRFGIPPKDKSLGILPTAL